MKVIRCKAEAEAGADLVSRFCSLAVQLQQADTADLIPVRDDDPIGAVVVQQQCRQLNFFEGSALSQRTLINV
jgi:hypothetical protein